VTFKNLKASESWFTLQQAVGLSWLCFSSCHGMELVWNFDSELGSVTGVTALWNFELGSVTLKRIGFFCFPIKHYIVFQLNTQHTRRE